MLIALGSNLDKQFLGHRRSNGTRREAKRGYIPTMEQGDILGHEFMGEVVEVGGWLDKFPLGAAFAKGLTLKPWRPARRPSPWRHQRAG